MEATPVLVAEAPRTVRPPPLNTGRRWAHVASVVVARIPTGVRIRTLDD